MSFFFRGLRCILGGESGSDRNDRDRKLGDFHFRQRSCGASEGCHYQVALKPTLALDSNWTERCCCCCCCCCCCPFYSNKNRFHEYSQFKIDFVKFVRNDVLLKEVVNLQIPKNSCHTAVARRIPPFSIENTIAQGFSISHGSWVWPLPSNRVYRDSLLKM